MRLVRGPLATMTQAQNRSIVDALNFTVEAPAASCLVDSGLRTRAQIGSGQCVPGYACRIVFRIIGGGDELAILCKTPGEKNSRRGIVQSVRILRL